MEPLEQLNGETNNFQATRCADCGAIINTIEDAVGRCTRCGEPFCRDCGRAQMEREEPMVCAACWESEQLAETE